MKFSDAVMLAGETPELLETADTLYGLKNLSKQEINTCSAHIINGNMSDKHTIIFLLNRASLLSLSLLFKQILTTNSGALKNYLARKKGNENLLSNSQVQREKIKLYYTFRLIASTFNDHNLLKLKKALNDND